MRDLSVAAKVLAPEGLTFVQAPIFSGRVPLRRRPANYSELLLAEGYADSSVLSGSLRAWLKLFDFFRPDVLVADHCPTALIAARIAHLAVVQLGCSFSIPAQAVPMPSFEMEHEISKEALLKSERYVLARINTAIRGCGSTSVLDSISALFDTQARLLACFEELDHYGVRPEARYIGPILTAGNTLRCAWESNDRRHVFAYLHGEVFGTDVLLNELADLDAEVVCVLTNSRQISYESVGKARMRMYSKPIDVPLLLQRADLVVSNGGGALSSQALLAGVPLLMMPGHMEQFVQSKCVERIGAGRLVGAKRSCTVFKECLHELLEKNGCRSSAKAIAKKYSSFNPSTPVNIAIRAIKGISKLSPCEHLHFRACDKEELSHG